MKSVGCMLVLFVGLTTSVKIPASFEVCKRGPQFDQCAERAVEKSLKTLVKGYQPLGLLSIDPLKISALNIDQGTGPVSINLKFRDLQIDGISSAKVRNFRSDFSKLTFAGKVNVGKLKLSGPYTISGKVLVLPISGDGQSTLILDDVNVDFTLHGKHFKKDGVTYMRVTQFDFQMETQKMDTNFSNLFGGDKALGDNMNKFLNENSVEILRELNPAIQEAFGAAFTEIANKIFTKVPFDDIFPKN